MKTYEMVALAQEDGKTYQCDDMFYNRKLGFHNRKLDEWKVMAWDHKNGLQDFVLYDKWGEVKREVPFMEAAQAFMDGKNVRVEFKGVKGSAEEGKPQIKIYKNSYGITRGIMDVGSLLTFYIAVNGKWYIEE